MKDKVYDWSEIRDQAIKDFKEVPSADLEQEIIDVFQLHPAVVVTQIADVTRGVQAGRIRSGWAFLRAVVFAPSPENVVVKVEGRREVKHIYLERAPRPEWVERWERARAHGDGRMFPEQAPGIRELHETALKDYPNMGVSGYEAMMEKLEVPHDDAGVWVQPGEYGRKDALDTQAEAPSLDGGEVPQ